MFCCVFVKLRSSFYGVLVILLLAAIYCSRGSVFAVTFSQVGLTMIYVRVQSAVTVPQTLQHEIILFCHILRVHAHINTYKIAFFFLSVITDL
jgi:hypothetical protein